MSPKDRKLIGLELIDNALGTTPHHDSASVRAVCQREKLSTSLASHTLMM